MKYLFSMTSAYDNFQLPGGYEMNSWVMHKSHFGSMKETENQYVKGKLTRKNLPMQNIVKTYKRGIDLVSDWEMFTCLLHMVTWN